MIILLVSLFFKFSSLYACEFNKEIQSVYSLSGPVTVIFKDLDLLKNKKLKAVSVFHPVDKKDFSGTFLPGGVFLSHDTIKKLSGSLLFYDESRELGRILSRYPKVKAIEIKTRSLTPLAVMERLEKDLSPFLVGCQLPQLTAQLKTRLEVLKKLVLKNSTFIFFLGLIHQNKFPELMMVQDGIVKWLIEQKLIQSYPSPLAYVNWSAKLIQQLPRNTFYVGVKDSGNSMQQDFKKNDHIINLTYPGALIPGSGQVEAMIFLFNNL